MLEVLTFSMVQVFSKVLHLFKCALQSLQILLTKLSYLTRVTSSRNTVVMGLPNRPTMTCNNL